MSPTEITPPVPPTLVTELPVDESTAKTALRIQAAKRVAKNTFKTLGVPVLAGAASALVVLRSTRASNDEDESSENTDTNE